MPDRIFYSICFGFILGVLLRSFLFVNFYALMLAGIIGCALFLFFILISGNKWGVLVSVFIIIFCAGIFRFSLADKSTSAFLESQVGQLVYLSGIIADEPDIRADNQKLTIMVGDQGNQAGILVTTDFTADFQYGDLIDFRGKLEKPANFITDQGKNFDYINYLKKDGIFYMVNYPNVEIISSGQGSKLKNLLFSTKDKFLEKINLAIQNPENLLMGGLILGERASFSEELRKNFIDTGTVHIIALSGFNITIVAEWFMKLFVFLPQNIGISLGILSILLFVMMTGGSSTALRAGIMASLALYARASGRNYDVARALLLAGVLMIIFNPFVLVFDVSFQLSFIATVALIFFTPKIEKYFLWVPACFGLRDIISVTSAVYIFVLPFIPFTMLLGFFTGFLGLIHYFLSVPLGYAAYLMLHYELRVINFLAKISFASISIPNFPFWLTLLIYAYFIHKLFGRSIKSFFIVEEKK